MKLKLPKIKIDSGTLKNVAKNFTPAGAIANTAQMAGLTSKNLIDQAFDAISGKREGGGGPGVGQAWDQAQQKSAEYEKLLAEQRIKNLAVGEQLTKDLQEQASGRAPSLAEAQMKAASNRSLAQTLAAAQTAGASPLSTRNFFQMRGQQSRDLAEQSGLARMQEQAAARQQLGGQIASQAGISRGDIGTGFDIGLSPFKMKQERELAQLGYDNQRAAARDAQTGKILGGFAGAGGTALGALFGGPAGAAIGGQLGTQAGQSLLNTSNMAAHGGIIRNYANGGLVDAAPFATMAAGGKINAPEITSLDDEANDIVPTMLSGGELVIPKTVVNSGHKAVSEFTKKLLEIEKKQGPNKDNGYAALVAMKLQNKKGPGHGK